MSSTFFDTAPGLRHTVSSSGAKALWAGRAMLAIVVLFLVFDISIKLVASPEAVQGTEALGFARHHLMVLALIELPCLVLYLIPRTAPIGAILWTGYLGGAIATHLRLDQPLLSHTLFPVYVALLLWGALYLRDERIRHLVQATRVRHS